MHLGLIIIMTNVSVIFCIILFICVLHGYSQASIYEVLAKNLSSHMREDLESTGSTTHQRGTEKEWHKGGDHLTQYKASSQRNKQSRNKNDGTYLTQGSRNSWAGSSSSSSHDEGQHYDWD
nr:uncharacterized protein LOC106677996 [Halyomorpha halys]